MDPIAIIILVLAAGALGYQLGVRTAKQPDEDEMVRLLVMCDATRRVKKISREKLEARIKDLTDEVVADVAGPSAADAESAP